MARDWRPRATPAGLRRRAELVRRIRDYFDSSGALEVATPVVLAQPASEPALASVALAPPAHGYLRTSPEAQHKRLLAAGCGDLYEIGPVVRNDAPGRRHLPEFTLLEWYRVGRNLAGLMDDIEALLRSVGCQREVARVAYPDLFRRTLGFELAQADDARLRSVLAQSPYAALVEAPGDRALLFDCLYLAFLEPALAHTGVVLLYDYPREQRAYARLSSAHTAARCELIIDGLEVANGYDEITDAAEQAACFDHERALRATRGLPQVEPDHAWLAALRAGMPRCAGAALGIERLLLAVDGAHEIAAMSAFPTENALSAHVSCVPSVE